MSKMHKNKPKRYSHKANKREYGTLKYNNNDNSRNTNPHLRRNETENEKRVNTEAKNKKEISRQ